MIAPQRITTELRQVDRARHATRRRARRKGRRVHRPALAVFALAVALLLPLLAYVTLTANVTSLNFALARAERDRTALVEEAQRLDDRAARLQSPERLALLATRLKLHDPHVYAVVRVPEPKLQPKPTGLAFFGTWFASGPR